MEISENLIGSWQAEKDVPCMSSNSVFTLPEGAIVSVTQVDKQFKKVLVESGPSRSAWHHVSFLNEFEMLD